MSCYYVQKTTKGSHSEEQLWGAINDVTLGRIIRAYKTAESKFRLRLRMTAGITSSARLGRKATFTAHREQELAGQVSRLAKLLS